MISRGGGIININLYPVVSMLKLTLACLRILSLGSIWSSLFFTAICLAMKECRVDPPWAVLPPVPLISWGGSGFRDFNGSWKNGLILYLLIFKTISLAQELIIKAYYRFLTADEELSLSSNLFFFQILSIMPFLYICFKVVLVFHIILEISVSIVLVYKIII